MKSDNRELARNSEAEAEDAYEDMDDADGDAPSLGGGEVEPSTLADSPSGRASVSSRTNPSLPTFRPSTHPGSQGSPGAKEERITGFGSRVGGATVQSATAVKALHGEELERARGFGRVITLLCVFGLIPVSIVAHRPGITVPWLHLTMALSLIVNGTVATWVWLCIESEQNPQRMMRIFGAVCVANAMVVQYYAGIFSPAPAVIAMGIAYFGISDDRTFALTVCGGASLSYLVMALLIISGLVPDLGMFSDRDAPTILRLAAVGTVLGVFAFMYWQARFSRNATHLAIERLDDALRLAQQREALLEEAHQNLDAALAAGGRRGPYSGRLAGPYLLKELLGRGGMGEVYAATHSQTNQESAVKLLLGNAGTNPGVVQRFMREAELTLKLHSPNLVEIYELGQLDSGAPYIAMELLRGRDLGWHLRKHRLLPLVEVLELTDQIAVGLEAAHEAGVIHRDLKPANVFKLEQPANPAGRWKVLDFGVAKDGRSHGTLTQHALIGTPGYMSPEQAQGRPVDPRSDLFSLGALIYRVLTGQPPFSAPELPKVLFDLVYRSPTRPSELMPSLPDDVDLVLAIALAKSMEDRFGSVSEFASALRAAAQGELAPSLRARGNAVVAKLPWGASVKPA